MSLSSLPKYPAPAVRASARPAPPVARELTRILAKLAAAAGIVLLLCWLRATADRMGRPRAATSAQAPATPAPRTPVEFEEVEWWYHNRWLFQTREQVEAELGPPTRHVPWNPELVERVGAVEHSNRHFGVPRDQVWLQWVDPKDPGKSVTVLFAGGKVYDKFKKGF